MGWNKFSYQGIRELCRDNIDSIAGRKEIANLLEHRRIRYIAPDGSFNFTKFGDFYFDSMGVMMLITKEKTYQRYHRPDLLSQTLWSTIPVIYAGVDTRYKDDSNSEIFTGDIVSCEGYVSLVRYFGDNNVPGLAGDNCEFLFDREHKLHKVGTVFSNLDTNLFNVFDVGCVYWPLEQYHPNGISREEVVTRATLALNEPVFFVDLPRFKRWKRSVYTDIDDYLEESDILTYFIGGKFEDADDEEYYDVYADNLPKEFNGEELSIPSPDGDFHDNSWTEAIEKFLLFAHRNPEKKYVLCDFVKTMDISPKLLHKYAITFRAWYEYNIANVALPFWIFNELAGLDMTGKD